MRKTRMETVEKQVVHQTVCDSCGKVAEGDDPVGWHHFSSRHSDWGNDSNESVESYDVCSKACFMEVLEQAIKSYGPAAEEPNPTLEFSSWDFDLAFAKSLLEQAEG